MRAGSVPIDKRVEMLPGKAIEEIDQRRVGEQLGLMQIVGRHQRLPAEVGLVRGRQMDRGRPRQVLFLWNGSIVTGELQRENSPNSSIPYRRPLT